MFTFSVFDREILLEFANVSYKKYLPVVPSGSHGDSVELTLSHNSLSLPVQKSIIPYLYIIGKHNTKDTIATYY